HIISLFPYSTLFRSQHLAIVIIAGESAPGLLSEASELAQTIGDQRYPHARFFEMLELLADAPSHVQPGEIGNRKRPHGEAEFVQDRKSTRLNSSHSQ